MTTTNTRGRYRKTGRLTHPLIVAVAFMVGLLLLIGACSADEPASEWEKEQAAKQAAHESMTQFEQIAEDCGNPLPGAAPSGIQVADAGRTLIIDHKGEDESYGASIDDVVCALARLDVPDAVVSRIDTTRALDGVQSGEWDGYTAVWSYHPDTGTNIIIEDAS